jgi:hypothetical protein
MSTAPVCAPSDEIKLEDWVRVKPGVGPRFISRREGFVEQLNTLTPAELAAPPGKVTLGFCSWGKTTRDEVIVNFGFCNWGFRRDQLQRLCTHEEWQMKQAERKAREQSYSASQ